MIIIQKKLISLSTKKDKYNSDVGKSWNKGLPFLCTEYAAARVIYSAVYHTKTNACSAALGFLYCFGRYAYLLFCVKNTKQTAGKRSVLYCVFYENEARSKQAHFNCFTVTIYRCYSIIIPKIAVKSSMFRIFCRNSKAKRQIAQKLQVKFVD